MNYLYDDKPIEAAANLASDSIIEQLNLGKKVLWLLTGGSGLTIAVKASQSLKDHDLSNLTVSLTDERFGQVGHNDENWQQLLNIGFELPGATLYRPLIGADIDQTTINFDGWMKKELSSNDYKIGLFGIGSDGHTAGIKPYSKAAVSEDTVASFVGEDFERITITFCGIYQLDQAIIQVSGADKKPTIKKLLFEDIDKFIQPAQILKQIKNATLISNNKEEEL